MITDRAFKEQPLLFDSLPETEPLRRKRRRTPAPPDPATTATAESAMAPFSSPFPPLAPAPSMAHDPATLTNPELRALVRALPDLRLSYLLTEAVRELKQRVQPAESDEGGASAEPNPALLRTARQVVGELSGEDD